MSRVFVPKQARCLVFGLYWRICTDLFELYKEFNSPKYIYIYISVCDINVIN